MLEQCKYLRPNAINDVESVFMWQVVVLLKATIKIRNILWINGNSYRLIMIFGTTASSLEMRTGSVWVGWVPK